VEVTELLQALIRNRCVNDGTPESGHESRSVDVLASYLDGLDLRRYESAPGRGNLVARIEGRDPSAPTLLLLGHLDVVPVEPDRWRHDPFGGELIDGEVWGRGAIDMLNQTASMAVAMRRLARSGFRPQGTVVYLAVADEEALGAYGAEWMLRNDPDAVRADYVLTETGGYALPVGGLAVTVAEKGGYWARLRVRGTPGHASLPWRADNALVTAAEVVRRLAGYRAVTRIEGTWRDLVTRAGLPEALLDPAGVDAYLTDPGTDPGFARLAHACTHLTVAPTVARGGTKANVIPDRVDLEVDLRTLPGDSIDDARAALADAIGDLADRVDTVEYGWNPATVSPVATPLWDTLSRVTGKLMPGARTVPALMVGATDARFFRRAGAVCYGYGLFTDRVTLSEFTARFHGDNERIDLESLRLSAVLWEAVARDACGGKHI
jgi:acetylornithine deacetylase/succinyl-diaminopimelate desuccinylase-like protein